MTPKTLGAFLRRLFRLPAPESRPARRIDADDDDEANRLPERDEWFYWGTSPIGYW